MLTSSVMKPVNSNPNGPDSIHGIAILGLTRDLLY